MTQEVYALISVIKMIVEDLSHSHLQYMENGNIHYTIDTNPYHNAFKEMVELVNHLLTQNTSNMMSLTTILDQISNGDFDVNLDAGDWNGDWALIPQSFGNLNTNLKGITNEINAMIHSTTVEGNLEFKIDTKAYQGDWKNIMRGLNSIAKAVDTPIKVISIYIDEMKQGNFDLSEIHKKVENTGLDANASSYNGAFYEIVSDMETTSTTISSYINEISEVLASLTNGVLTHHITRPYSGSFIAIKSSLTTITTTLNKTMTEIYETSDQVLSGAKQIAQSAIELSNGTNKQADSIAQLNQSMASINEQTKQNTDNSHSANLLSSHSTENALAGNEAMISMLEAMSSIKDSSDSIAKIINVIQDIAFQTNLLALNASVEAARAGEHGKGFAVVAEEVRSLAGRSKTAAEETTRLIESSMDRVNLGNSIAETTSDALKIIVSSAEQLLSTIENISIASQQQLSSVTEVSQSITLISSVVNNNSAISEETSAAAQELNAQAEVLRNLVSYFKV